MIRLRILGCSGGIGGPTRRTTSYALNDTVLIDAGTGVGELSLDELARIDHVVLTHAHLDHIACLPLMADSVTALRTTPLQVWALPAVIDILATHVFNDLVWPDFTKIPDTSNPFVKLNPLPADGPLELAGLQITPLPASHGIPACGYRVERDGVAIAFSGDTADCPAFWEKLEGDLALRAVIVECSYPSRMVDMAHLSMHLDAGALKGRLAALPGSTAAILIHRKPGLEEEITREWHHWHALHTSCDLRLPLHGQVYAFSSTARPVQRMADDDAKTAGPHSPD